MTDIFISYTCSDRKWAAWIGHELEALGYRPHLHEWELSGGDDIAAWMEKTQSTADHTVLVVSEAYLHAPYSSWERRAAQWAAIMDRPRFALPVFVKACKAPPLLATLQRCDLYDITEEDARTRLKAFLEPAAKPARGVFPGTAKAPSAQTGAQPGPEFPGKVPSSNALKRSIGQSRPLLPRATLVLTSESPRREELLRTIGWSQNVDYLSAHASVNLPVQKESLNLDDAKHIAVYTACQKITWLKEHPGALPNLDPGCGWIPSQTIVIGVDTIVFCGNKILDRPLLKSLDFAGPLDIEQARQRAKEMLMEQIGKQIHIITGLAVALMDGHNSLETKVVVTEAELRNYSEADIDNYISCSEPFDKAGAFGIQGKGVSLFKGIKGSYTNVVGLPLLEFIAMLQKICKDTFTIPELKSSLAGAEATPAGDAGSAERSTSLSVVCVGDINYDFIYDRLPPNFFANLRMPGQKIIGEIHRAVGGTAINFAKGAKRTGFSPCYVVGVIGGDALGTQIVNELSELEIVPIHRHDPTIKTSIAIIVRDTAEKDTSLTLTDAHQSLPHAALSFAPRLIKGSDVFYCSGYCLTDRNRHAAALSMLRAAKEFGLLVVLDVVVGMSKEVPLDELQNTPSDEKTRHLVDVVVSEMPEIFGWFNIAADSKDELEVWEQHKEMLVEGLRDRFPVAILRTSRYTHEVVITPDRVDGPTKLDYGTLHGPQKTGYGDFRTAKQVHSFLSPRIVLASKSPQRRKLLSQIVAPSKIQVIASTCAEERRRRETPHARVQRLALEKAESVFLSGKFDDDIELIIGADTEIIRRGSAGKCEMIGHPTDAAGALRDLTQLNNDVHYALTGIAIIGGHPQTRQVKKYVSHEETEIRFINASVEQLRAYAESGEPIGRAGAYAIQGLGTMLVQGIKGSYSNVVGLPLEKLSQVLAHEFGKPIWGFDKVSRWCFPDPIKALCDEIV